MEQKSIVASIVSASGTTPTGLKDMLLRAGTAEVSGEAKARVKVILDSLSVLPLTEGNKLLKATAKVAKGTAEEKTVKVRVSEARRVFGACKFFPDFKGKAESAGWHEAVRMARESLKAAGITANGDKVLTSEQKAEKAETAASVQIMAEALAGTSKENRTQAFLAEVATKAAEGAQSRLMDDRAKAHAERIVETEGWEYASTLISHLLNHEPKAETGDVQQAQAA